MVISPSDPNTHVDDGVVVYPITVIQSKCSCHQLVRSSSSSYLLSPALQRHTTNKNNDRIVSLLLNEPNGCPL